MPGTTKTTTAKKASVDVNRERKILICIVTRYITDVEFGHRFRRMERPVFCGVDREGGDVDDS
jgi:hypothetical protein